MTHALLRPGQGGQTVFHHFAGRRGWRGITGSAVLLAGLVATLPAPGAAADTPSGCPAPAAGQVTCAALLSPAAVPATAGARADTTPPPGLTPTDLQDAYGLDSWTAGTRQTVAVVTAYDDPTAEQDMGIYRGQYGIPACTTAGGCFSKVNQTGGSSYPGPGPEDWTLATAEGLDMISAVCPNCHILLVEAYSTHIGDEGAAENEAVTLGARFVVSLWLTSEANYGESELKYDAAYFDHPGVVMTAPDGNDGGYGTYYPAASPDVVAVGGTTLTAASGTRGWTETAWSGTGSGCSPYEAKPSWQTDPDCTNRMLNDVSAVADNGVSPVDVYDTNSQGWVDAGGNDVSASIIAATYALAGTPAAGSAPPSYPYASTDLINDITTGSDGHCSITYYCTAGPGYDGPTGLGTPASTIPFSSAGATPTGQVPSGIFGMCLDDSGGSTTNDTKVDVYTCNNDAQAQQWTMEDNGTVQDQGHCLDVHDSATTNNSPVDLYSCNGGAQQQWRVRYPAGTTTPYSGTELENTNSGLCLNDPGSSATKGTQLVIYACNGTGAQQWTIPYATPTSTSEITSPITNSQNQGMCLDDWDGKAVNNNKVDIYTCNDGQDTQQWTVASDGTVQINGMCLNNSGSANTPNNPVDLYTCNDTGAQQWIPQTDGALLNPETDKCLNDPGSDQNPGTQLGIYACNQTAAQVWNLPSP
jgi:hypothetical protein